MFISFYSYYQLILYTFSIQSDLYYYRDIDINGKKGYISIKQVEDRYMIDFMYNYAHIESLVTKENINSVILNSSYILSTVKFNNILSIENGLFSVTASTIV